MVIIKAIIAMVVGAVMLWGFAESYTRNTYGAFSPQHSAVLSLIPGPAPELDNLREAKRRLGRQ